MSIRSTMLFVEGALVAAARGDCATAHVKARRAEADLDDLYARKLHARPKLWDKMLMLTRAVDVANAQAQRCRRLRLNGRP